MEYEFAPMEGITDAVFRRTHRKHYPGIARYYMPFISPTQHRCFTPRHLRELAPENNPNVPLIPQLLTRNADDFLWAAGELAAMGFQEVNLNLGCPSGTVTAKGKGAGLLAHPDKLDRFLEEIYRESPLPVSIKTRIGISDPAEFEKLLAIYEQYPVRRLIIHLRTRDEMYRSGVHPEMFSEALHTSPLPLSYNGDVFTPDDCRVIQNHFPKAAAIMLGRGIIADPGIVAKLFGLPSDKETLYRFHTDLCEEYPVVFGNQSSAAHRMKAIWHYLLYSFRQGNTFRKKIIKAKKWQDLQAVFEEVFQSLELLPHAKGIE